MQPDDAVIWTLVFNRKTFSIITHSKEGQILKKKKKAGR